MRDSVRGALLVQGKKEGRPAVVIHAEKHVFAFSGDILALLERAATETIPPFRDDKTTDQLSLRNAQVCLHRHVASSAGPHMVQFRTLW